MKRPSPYTVLYADDALVVFNKASGLLTAADRYDIDAPRLDTAAEEEFGRLYAVHRIDKDTSGAVVYARTPEAHRNLSLQFENRVISKTYHALVHGRPLWTELQISLPLQPDGDVRHRTIVNKRDGKSAITDFRLLGTCGPYSWIEAHPLTGRTHQIRVHLAENGLSIVCDPLYGGNLKPVRLSDIKRSWHGDLYEEKPLLDRLALHAFSIGLAHPVSGEFCVFNAPYPKDMDSTRRQLAKLYGTDPLAAENRN
jgi:RluA family pseudouridine synthase